jgi:large subunit ribosomal protein L6
MCRLKRKRFKFFYTSIDGNRLLIKGPITTLSFPIPANYSFERNLISSPKYINSLARQLFAARYGLVFGFFAEILPEGVGFRFLRYPWAPQVLGLSLGYSHPIFWRLPRQCFFRCHKYRLFIFSGNKSIINDISLQIKNLRHPDAYKGKGLKFARDPLKLKPGKLRQR